MSAKRPGRDRRDRSVLIACAHCGTLFHPWRYHKDSAYCSRLCRSRAAVTSAITKAQLGAVDAGSVATPPAPPQAPASLPPPPAEPVLAAPELPPSVTSQLWYQAGERRRQLAEELLKPDERATTRRDQVLILAGDGAALKVRQRLLVAQEGWTAWRRRGQARQPHPVAGYASDRAHHHPERRRLRVV
jgi:hypothetical protein